MTVRSMTDADRARCADVYLLARRARYHWAPPGSVALEDFERSVEGERVLVAELDGAIAGFASIRPDESLVHNLFVDPDRQGRGVGTALLDHAARAMPGPVRLRCDVRNTRACDFYARRGWIAERWGSGPKGDHVVFLLRKGARDGRIAGVGAVFVPCLDPEAMAAWYEAHLGLAFREDSDGNPCADLFARDDEEPGLRVETALTFVRAKEPSRGFMLDYRVRGFDALVARLAAKGVSVETQELPSGRFAWFSDLEGHRVEVHEPR